MTMIFDIKRYAYILLFFFGSLIRARYDGIVDAESSALLKRRAEIMSNSGYKYTEAVKWILNEL